MTATDVDDRLELAKVHALHNGASRAQGETCHRCVEDLPFGLVLRSLEPRERIRAERVPGATLAGTQHVTQPAPRFPVRTSRQQHGHTTQASWCVRAQEV